MKKIAAILLLLLFTFNQFGYRLWFYLAEQKADMKWELLLDKYEYNPSQFITITIPISLPYQTNWKNFERIDGEITFNGKIYKYVERKVYNGNLILHCLPNYNKMRLQTARNDFFKYANDLNQNADASKKNTHSKPVMNGGEYICFAPPSFSYNHFSATKTYSSVFSLQFPHPFVGLTEKPPQV